MKDKTKKKINKLSFIQVNEDQKMVISSIRTNLTINLQLHQSQTQDPLITDDQPLQIVLLL